MLAFLKGLPFGHYVVMAAILAASYIWMDYKHTQQQLADQILLTQQWQRAAEVQQDIDRRDTIILRAGQQEQRTILESPDAQTLFPAELSSTWAAGIDRVRDAESKPTNTEHELSRSNRRETERNKSNVWGSDELLNRSGKSASSL